MTHTFNELKNDELLAVSGGLTPFDFPVRLQAQAFNAIYGNAQGTSILNGSQHSATIQICLVAK